MNSDTAKSIISRALIFSSTLFLSLMVVNVLPANKARRQTYFARAAADGNLRHVRLLHMTGANVNSRGNCCTPLFLAAGEGRLEVVRYLLDQGADVNAREQSGRTAVTEAAFFGKHEVIKELLLRGADINAIAEDGTALDIAVKSNNTTVIDLLKHYGGKRACEIRGSC
jgi:ankyrin repeat protein